MIGYKQENVQVQQEEIQRPHNRRKLCLKGTKRYIMAPNFSCVVILRIAEDLNLWSETFSKYN